MSRPCVPVGQNEEFGQESECTKVGLKARVGNETPVEGSMQASMGICGGNSTSESLRTVPGIP